MTSLPQRPDVDEKTIRSIDQSDYDNLDVWAMEFGRLD
jgi:hypothetical protein